MLGRMPVNHRPAILGSRRSYGGQDRDRRDIWSFSGIWQDFAGIRSHMADGINGDSSRHGPAYCRNLLLTIDVRPFLSNAADTPATGNNDVGREPDRTPNGPVVQASPGDYLVWRHDAVRQNREKPS
ncbi:hypothetical protein [Mesorhizobium sp.]|uniref:hypothetical protein n=1 Tax=Mesorhizobium sp. TaxID=1871066 RepID=UPI000FE7D4EE|nr:hypothetical protein [Mesorhizobium sp.]RWK50685.1 MAG: hypothetical protein EOR47_10100 [Mesorhizobium sp.]RWL14430.1 MAG: hypothetical protein EOR45_01020 [Mesorhizobium sp.]TIQ20458.1 MAG: hypothetical protein E5X51_16285 [Mesorhizobium sp.]TIQ91508.1 MAG: hypothetical protein E5X44_18190 [Mesorhizobium sp.]